MTILPKKEIPRLVWQSHELTQSTAIYFTIRPSLIFILYYGCMNSTVRLYILGWIYHRKMPNIESWNIKYSKNINQISKNLMAYIISKKPEMWQCQKKWLIIVRYRKEFQHHIYTHEPSKLAWIKRFEVYWAQDLLLYSIITTSICGYTSFCTLRMKSILC